MKTLVFFLEEPSAREMLQGVLPLFLPSDIIPRYLIFKGKQDLEKNLVGKLRGWRQPDSLFVVLRDQDNGDCERIKEDLVNLCKKADRPQTLVRIACRELESFYLGDFRAIEEGLKLRGIVSQQRKAKFRNPDGIINPALELKKLTQGKYQKISGSRAIAPHLNITCNNSHSFLILVRGIDNLVKAKI